MGLEWTETDEDPVCPPTDPNPVLGSGRRAP